MIKVCEEETKALIKNLNLTECYYAANWVNRMQERINELEQELKNVKEQQSREDYSECTFTGGGF